LFSTFMLQMLAELYAVCPEEGDLDKPKLIIFIDEAHLIFQEATDALMQQIETVIKLIRSKGVGIFFCTQNPQDIPAAVLSQLGMKVQHALRAFTAADRKVIQKTAENYPLSDFYKTDELLTQLGIGEALVTLLNEKGIPTPLAHVMLKAPESRMDVLSEDEISGITSKSKLVAKYNREVDSESAYEILTAKLEEASKKEEELQEEKEDQKTQTKERGFFDNPVVKQVGRTAAGIITRSLLGALGLGGRSSRKRKTLF
jgi:DNA helicase HerA-like ATPase